MVDLEKLSEGVPLDQVVRALLLEGWDTSDLMAMTEHDLRVAYFTEFYVDEDGWT